MKKGKIRFLYMTLVGVGIFFFLHLLVPKNQQNANDLWNLLTCIAITMIVWEGNINIDRRLDKKYTWETNAKNRILLQLITSTTYTVSSIFISLYFSLLRYSLDLSLLSSLFPLISVSNFLDIGKIHSWK